MDLDDYKMVDNIANTGLVWELRKTVESQRVVCRDSVHNEDSSSPVYHETRLIENHI